MSAHVYILPTFKEAVGHWRFRNNLSDNSYSGSHLSNNGITSSNFSIGYTESGITACSLGAGEYGYISNGDADHFIMLEQNFTVEMWVKTSSSLTMYPIKHNFDTFFTGWYIELGTDGKPNLVLGDGGLAWDHNIMDAVVNDDEWHHVAFVVDRDSSEIRGYIDGEEDSASPFTMSVSGSLGNPGQDLRVGESASGLMTLDELLVTKKVFSATEIAQHYEGHPDPSTFVYSGSADVTTNVVPQNLNVFDIKLQHACNHQLASSQYTLEMCPRCMGDGYYYDIKFNAYGRPDLLSIEDKLQQALEKMVRTSENLFHDDVYVDIKSRVGQLQEDIEPIITYDLQRAIATMKENNRSVVNLSPRSQIARLDSIEVVKEGQTSLRYIVKITTVSGETREITGNVDIQS